jgi:hypothetical protein
MPTGNPRGRPKDGQSPIGTNSDLLSILHDGATWNQLALMFKMRTETVARKLRDLPPVGKRSGYFIYDIHQAARRLVKPLDVEAVIRTMKSEDLPPDLQKNFWLGLKAKDEYLTAKGRLFPVEEIVSQFSAAAKDIRIVLQLSLDRFEKRTEVTDAQRAIFQETIDSTLRLIHEKLEHAFHVPEPEPGEKSGNVAESSDDPEYESGEDEPSEEDEWHGL